MKTTKKEILVIIVIQSTPFTSSSAARWGARRGVKPKSLVEP
jgi:hypothetical protein